MLLQDQRDLQQHAVVVHKVELSDKVISLVSLSTPSLQAKLVFCSSVPQQCNLLIIESSQGIVLVILFQCMEIITTMNVMLDIQYCKWMDLIFLLTTYYIVTHGQE